MTTARRVGDQEELLQADGERVAHFPGERSLPMDL